jgi:hypothetical protein
MNGIFYFQFQRSTWFLSDRQGQNDDNPRRSRKYIWYLLHPLHVGWMHPMHHISMSIVYIRCPSGDNKGYFSVIVRVRMTEHVWYLLCPLGHQAQSQQPACLMFVRASKVTTGTIMAYPSRIGAFKPSSITASPSFGASSTASGNVIVELPANWKMKETIINSPCISTRHYF